MHHRRRHVASKFSRVQKSSNLDPKKTFLCFFLLNCVYKSIKKSRHNIVHFSLLKTITISECLKIVFDAFFFRRSSISGYFSLHLRNYFFRQDNHDDMSTLDLFCNLCCHVPRSFVLTEAGIFLPVY